MMCYQAQGSGWLQCNHLSVRIALWKPQVLDILGGFGSGAPCATTSPVTGGTFYWEVP